MAHPPMMTGPGLVRPVPRRVRATVGARTVVDTLEARYVWEHAYYPQFALPPLRRCCRAMTSAPTC